MLTALLLALASQTVSPPAQLNASTFAQVHAYAQPSSSDLGFMNLDWKSSIHEAINAAREADKPILLWMYFGDPRGHC